MYVRFAIKTPQAHRIGKRYASCRRTGGDSVFCGGGTTVSVAAIRQQQLVETGHQTRARTVALCAGMLVL